MSEKITKLADAVIKSTRKENPVTVCWMRRDLRLEDNHALWQALRSGCPVLLLFIFDTEILGALREKEDRRVAFIFSAIETMNRRLRQQYNSGVLCLQGKPEEIFEKLLADYQIGAVCCNEDYEPYAITRDRKVEQLLARRGVPFRQYKDQVIFHKEDILTAAGKPYIVYTPYSRAWLLKYHVGEQVFYPSEEMLDNLLHEIPPVLSIEETGFHDPGFCFPPAEADDGVIATYDRTRDFPALQDGVTRMGVHLRFGTVSIRRLVLRASLLNEAYLKELIWREFFMQVLWHFPYVTEGPFRKKYEAVLWENNEEDFYLWCNGNTGYPLVDAGMRELNATGFMHNRVRMITASFLTKHLLIDWRWGESRFAEKLLDYDLAANNGNWQWVAGTGCDAAPWFRIFNPAEQQKRFDPRQEYIRRWIPELGTPQYPAPVIGHTFARQRALERYNV
ncbi:MULTISPECIES: cryptochrome/photolyase family protein [Proteiniphilum]|jgi:deoxyribodipyrimidine photo-lyase|uniref:cryptochrome/photolyase family protein n=1 Tax=Proteiniphilum TaxID=294702 RepID=UPI001EEA26A1|nr:MULTISPECIES: deoxyribodipyrimidine photo-lyase [Proteiniphilum]ULB33879.1 deoxyribodipyrimidine photo-lyase [Proteiniphilum propionicum]